MTIFNKKNDFLARKKIASTIKKIGFIFLHFLACLMFIVAMIFLFGMFGSCDTKMDDFGNGNTGTAIPILPEPEPEIEPEPELELEEDLEPSPELEAEIDFEPIQELEEKPKLEIQLEPEPELEAEPDFTPEVEPESEPVLPDPEPEPEPEPVPCDMAILVYMAADNNLESSAIHDFNEMEATEIPENVTVLVLLDRAEGYDQTNGNWTGTRLYKIAHDDNGNNSVIVSERLECERLDLSLEKETELDMGKKETLTGFIEFAKQEYEPKKMSLIIWGHGNGWKSASDFNFSSSDSFPTTSESAKFKAFSMDSTTNSYLTVCELRQGIENAMGSEKLDFIGFDTCFGSTIEVAYELRNCAKIMGGSTGVIPSDGWDYERLLSKYFWGDQGQREQSNLLTNSDLSGRKFAEIAIEQFISQYSDYPYTSFITLNLESLEELYNSFNSWCYVVSKNIVLKTLQNQLRAMLIDKTQVLSYYSASSAQESGYDYYLDIYDMSEKISNFFQSSSEISWQAKSELETYKKNLQESLLKATIQSWSAENKSLFSMGVFFALFTDSGIPYNSHPIEYFYRSNVSNQNMFSKNSDSWVPTDSKNRSLIDKIFYQEF